jgi:ubiquitin C
MAQAAGQQLFVKTLEGRTHTIDITPTTTIGDVKLQLSARTGQPVANIRLAYAGKELDNAMLANVLEDSPTMLIRKAPAATPAAPAVAVPAAAAAAAAPSQQLFIKTLEGRTHTVDITPTTTIGDVKLQLSARTGQPVANIRLAYAGKELDNAMLANVLEDSPTMLIRKAPAAAAAAAAVLPTAPGGPR